MPETIAGIPMSVLREMASSVNGELRNTIHLGWVLAINARRTKKGNQGRHTIQAERLGLAVPPDPLGPTTTSLRPTSLAEAISHLDQVQAKIKNA